MHDYETVTTAAKLTNITPRTIYKYLKQGIVTNFGTDVVLVSVKQVRETNNKRKPTTIDWDTIQQHIKQQQTISQIAFELSISASNLYARCKKDNGVSWREFVLNTINLCKP
jgi:DNA invertase Pin-like site-specific DNA recombinase